MNTQKIVALILIVLGVVVLAYAGISFTTAGQPVEFLGMRFATKVNHFIPPVAGAIAVIGGIVLFLTGRKSS